MKVLGGALRRFRIDQIEWNPAKEWEVFAACRRRDSIRSWDIRHRKAVVAEFPRLGGRTNQRMRFDVGWGGRWLGTGDEVRKIGTFPIKV